VDCGDSLLPSSTSESGRRSRRPADVKASANWPNANEVSRKRLASPARSLAPISRQRLPDRLPGQLIGCRRRSLADLHEAVATEDPETVANVLAATSRNPGWLQQFERPAEELALAQSGGDNSPVASRSRCAPPRLGLGQVGEASEFSPAFGKVGHLKSGYRGFRPVDLHPDRSSANFQGNFTSRWKRHESVMKSQI